MTATDRSTRTAPARPIALAVLTFCLLLLAGPVGAQTDEDPAPAPEAPATDAAEGADEEPEAGWAVQPAGPDGPGLRSAFTYNVEPGQTLRDSVSISNLSSEPITFAIYAKDAFNTPVDGAFALLADEEENVDVGSWVTIEVDEYTVPAGRRADIPFELTVPEDATPGDHAGGIIAADVDVVDEVERDGVTIAVRQRVAARIYIRVAGPLTPELRIRDLQVDTDTGFLPFAQGGGTITYTVENVGNTRVESATESRVTGLFGRKVAGLESQDLPELLPGGSVQVTETWEGNPPLERLTAEVRVRSLDAELTETASRSFFVWSWLTPLLLGLVLVLVGLFTWRRRRRANAGRPKPRPDAADTPEPAGATSG